MEVTVVALVSCLLGCVLFYWARWKQNYWKRKRVFQLPGAHPIFGHVRDSLLMRVCEAELYQRLYQEGEGEPAVGVYKLWVPTLLVRSPTLARKILVSEFDSFRDNDIYSHPSDMILSTHPFTTTGDRWKQSRGMASAAVTPFKIKSKIMPGIVTTCEDLVRYLTSNQDRDIEGRKLGGDFTTDVSLRTIFGQEGDSLRNTNSEYRQYNSRVFDADFLGNLLFTLSTYFPRLCRVLNLRMTPKWFEDFYTGLVGATVAYRKEQKVQGNDYLQYLIHPANTTSEGLTVQEMARHTMSMLWDGYTTSSVVIGHCLAALADHPQIQSTLASEVADKVPQLQHLSYTNIESMPYLDAFMSEVLRTCTPIPVLHKVCTRDRVLEEEGRTFHLTEGDSIIIPLWTLHNDPAFLAHPHTFHPERFLEPHAHQEVYFPFGLGPRACLGTKLGLTQTKACIIAVTKYFRVVRARVQQDQALDEKSTFFLLRKSGIWLKFHSK